MLLLDKTFNGNIDSPENPQKGKDNSKNRGIPSCKFINFNASKGGQEDYAYHLKSEP